MLINILKEAVKMNKTLNEYVSIEDIENIVSETYKKYDKNIFESTNNNNNCIRPMLK